MDQFIDFKQTVHHSARSFVHSRNSSNVPVLVVVGGATATGKSSLALAIAERLGGVILSADSRQVYQEFDIGTAKPTLTERQRVPHYLIDICHPTETMTVAAYQHQAQVLLYQMHQNSTALPLLVGGTGLYIDSLVKGLQIPAVAPDSELRSQLLQLSQPHCYQLLQQVDPQATQRIHPNDQVRTLRALEVFYVTGRAMSEQQGENPPTYPILYLGLDCTDPAVLKQRIEARTHHMVEAGLVSEVSALIAKYGSELPLLKTLGYGEFKQYLAGDGSLATAIAQTVTHTRQFAKRQRTWFRQSAQIEWLEADAPDLIDQAMGRVKGFLEQASHLRLR
ncbi:MAG: tRNA (adenosine(37)-N6)-dimethylallyltransferase MiaA [Leptolyngbyaceae cyanobacterium RM1_1_2]|nr:tRNA (adenosine(37)-N6)-dimethylallyltransferase MiaA [Leptolyngbyaceae cyanobacterium RM1_1_2]